MICPDTPFWLLAPAVFGYVCLIAFPFWAFIKWALAPRGKVTHVGTIPRKRRLFRDR